MHNRRQPKYRPTPAGARPMVSLVDVFAPPAALLAKLGSIIVHIDEGAGAGGHEFDWTAARSLIADREVQAWLAGMDAKGLLPKRRS